MLEHVEENINKETDHPSLVIGKRVVGNHQPLFFIAEIGQNHQGDIKIAKKLIDEAVKSGVDCVKFQKTDLNEKFTQEFLSKPYTSTNSWGKTYGEHKKFLEFTFDEFLELKKHAEDQGVIFSASAMDINSFRYLESINVPFIKIGSGDSNNIQMLKVASKSATPLIISTGMLHFEQVKTIYNLMKEQGKTNFALLHCVSSYPTPLEDVNLRVIELYKKNFPDIVIGYSGHETGIEICLGATALGARIIERHITLDNNQKGSDHICSLLPQQFQEMIQKSSNILKSLGQPKKIIAPSEITCSNKLKKCIVAAKHLKRGQTINEGDLKTKVTDPKGIDGFLYEDIIGTVLSRDLNTDDLLLSGYYEKIDKA